MIPTAPRHHDDEAAAALMALGVSEADLHQAILDGESDRRTRGPQDPAIVGGIVAWGATVGSLRSTLMRRGWAPLDHKGIPLIVGPDRRVAITVAAGNAGTGLPGPVSTKHQKGIATADLIEFRQLGLFGHHSPEPPARYTYFLLQHRTTTAIRCELSLPRSYKRRGGSHIEITEWDQRIILEPVSLVSEGRPPGEIEPTATAEVEIAPREDREG